MPRISTFTRLSLGLVFLTLTTLSLAYLLDLIPDKRQYALAERKVVSESLAVLCSKAAEKDDIATIRETIEEFVQRNKEVLSAALRKADGTLPAVSGYHHAHWQDALADKSNATHVRVPIYQGSRVWGNVEVTFRPIFGKGLERLFFNPIIELVGFVLLVGFILYRLFLGKVLKQLDPSSVVPPRVQAALNTMVEGIALLDSQARILMANEAFSKKVSLSQESLLGCKIDSLKWEKPSTAKSDWKFPWWRTLENDSRQAGTSLHLSDESGNRRTFMVNTSPVMDSTSRSRGVLATFDDVTRVEEKNEQLREMVSKLEFYSEKVEVQNRKLEYLATRDPLTGCHNRRSFFELFEKEFKAAKRYGHSLSCIMFDIDHFKAINDNHGHAAGDDVLREIAEVVGKLVRETDTLGRYGGEEFCIVQPHSDLLEAAQAAERFRAAIEAYDFSGLTVTASFGVASMENGTKDPAALINKSDEALYAAKNGGRNRVTVCNWQTSAQESTPAAPEASKSEELGTKPAFLGKRENGNPKHLALRMVHAGLTESALQSEEIGLQGSLAAEKVVQLNKAGGWGRQPDKARRAASGLSAAKVADILGTSSAGGHVGPQGVAHGATDDGRGIAKNA